ncbi:DUF4363 domain-containing protein [Clostridium botulinum]|uniref:DUF4363 domain-containing protein n=3 Tax=Clostridium TaxID=1485 RepID=A0A6B4EMM9_CLOSG|nr:DUF4363 domain-containing protein [Clostridium botulinum]MBE6055409.1 DUF4363 family protein [Clostridium sp.]NFD94516.1 DUF4363 family protein [Clostridium sporogenes]AVP62949.1 DUF4363 domain-containing protein [Clostridium botulinum]NFE45990.1 DUF4363 family protein [Clostridium sporogenes]
MLFLILIFTLVNYSFKLNTTCKNFMNQCDELEELVSSESWEKAYGKSLELFNDWQDNHFVISMVINHSEIDNINNELWKLTQYVKCKSEDESLASIHVVKFLLEHIIKMEKINIENIV